MAAISAQAAVIYKWVDADGVVHFSDQPQPGAEKIVTAASPATAGSGRRAGPAASPPGRQSAAGALDYSQFSISSPAPDQAFFGDEVIGVHLDLQPSLKANQTITWHLNGKQLDAQADAVGFALPHLDRGSYAIAATLTDQETGESQTSNSVSFYVRQPTALSPQHK